MRNDEKRRSARRGRVSRRRRGGRAKRGSRLAGGCWQLFCVLAPGTRPGPSGSLRRRSQPCQPTRPALPLGSCRGALPSSFNGAVLCGRVRGLAQLPECIRAHPSRHHRTLHPRPPSRDQETKQYHVSCQHDRSRDRIHTTLISASLSLPRSSVHYHPCFHDMDTPQQALEALQREVNLIVSATIAANFCLLPPTLTQRTARIHRKAVCRRQQLGS